MRILFVPGVPEVQVLLVLVDLEAVADPLACCKTEKGRKENQNLVTFLFFIIAHAEYPTKWDNTFERCSLALSPSGFPAKILAAPKELFPRFFLLPPTFTTKTIV